MIKLNEEMYRKITAPILRHPRGVQTLNIINKAITMLIYSIYPIFLLGLLVSRDLRFWKVLLIPGISFVLVSLFRKYIDAPRPYEVLNIVPLINKDTKGQSFPSRHVFSVFVIAMTLYYISMPVGITLIIVGVLLGIVRVVGGVHFPKDVIVGAIVGILISVVSWNYMNF